MSDWLEGQLSRHLTPVTAPEELRVRLGFARAKRREFPRTILAVAAAVVVMMAGGLANERRNSEAAVEFASSDPGAISVWLGHAAGGEVPLREAEGVRFGGARGIRRRGVKRAAV